MQKGYKHSDTKRQLPERVTVLGAARSGIAAVKFLMDKVGSVFLSETCSTEALEKILASHGIEKIACEAGGHTPKVLESDLIICSPGIPSDIPILKEARNRGIAVWSEIELAYRHCDAAVLAVTGSTGKSTTVSLVGSILDAVGKENVVAGNIGLPLISVGPALSPQGVIVAEISSFQLENIDLFKPRIAMVLNLMKNHLDRYTEENAYYEAKKMIARNLDAGDSLVINAHDPLLRSWVDTSDHTVGTIICFGAHVPGRTSVWEHDNRLYMNDTCRTHEIGSIASMKIKGPHNRENACAAAAAALALGIEHKAILDGICAFPGLAHRMEFVCEIDGVAYYNDSKATTAESIACAVDSFEGNVHLLAGGKDKGCDFAGIRGKIQHKVKSVSLYGEAAERIISEWHGLASMQKVESLTAALLCAQRNACAGDVILLSPGCSSFDMFSDFEHRGRVFKELVCSLTKKEC